jgi:hypothetical protein
MANGLILPHDCVRTGGSKYISANCLCVVGCCLYPFFKNEFLDTVMDWYYPPDCVRTGGSKYISANCLCVVGCCLYPFFKNEFLDTVYHCPSCNVALVVIKKWRLPLIWTGHCMGSHRRTHLTFDMCLFTMYDFLWTCVNKNSPDSQYIVPLSFIHIHSKTYEGYGQVKQDSGPLGWTIVPLLSPTYHSVTWSNKELNIK